MKKKFCVLLLSTILLLTACSGNNSGASSSDPAGQPTSVSEETSQSSEESSNASSAESQSTEESKADIAAVDSIEVDEGLFDVTLTIPKDYVGESTQVDLDKTCEENGFKSITLNEDGSATYVMTKKQHAALMEDYRTQINNSLTELVGSEDYPNFTNIEANDAFTEFTVTTKSTELDMNESLSVMIFYISGGMYNVFSGNEADNISVTFINADSGETIKTANSSEMGK